MIHKNIPRLYVLKAAKWLMLYMPIVVPFYESNMLSMKDIMVLQAIYSIAIVILEIPSGYMADVWGRRKTLILGAILGTIGFSIYGFSHGFIGFLIAEIVLGIGQSCVSGADSAMLYDSLLEERQEAKYSKLEGRISSLGNLTEAIAAIIGGVLAGISLRAPYIGQIVIASIAIPAAFTLIEPVRHKKLLNKDFKEILDISRFTIFENRELRRNIVFSALTGCATLTMAWFAQPFFEFNSIDIKWFGYLWAALNLTVAFTSFTAHQIESKLGQRGSIILITLIIPLSYLALSQLGVIAGMAVLFCFYLVRGFATPILKDYINRITSSEIRATVLSIRNFIIRVIFAITGPIIGWIKDIYDLPMALLSAGITFFILNTIAAIFFLKSRGKMNEKVDYISKTRPS